MRPDNLSLLVTLADGSIEKTVVQRHRGAEGGQRQSRDFARLKNSGPQPQMVSFTITEKGYSLIRADGSLLPDVAADFGAGPAAPASYIGKLAACVTSGTWRRNCPGLGEHGQLLHNATGCGRGDAFAEKWVAQGLAQSGFAAYLADPAKISFPWTMIDKITPRPDEAVRQMLLDCGFEDAQGTVTAKNTFIAPFVNAEETQWLVMEDRFPNGHPPLELGGVLFTDRETVDKVEKMKVCTCLNPLHTSLAIFGCLLGYTKISDEMKDPDLVRLIETVGYVEGLPVVVNPGILDPKAFLDNVVQVRFPNPFMPDTPQRIACDTSQKLPIRFGETLKAYLRSPELDIQTLKAIPLVLAGWLRYLSGVDDQRNPLSPLQTPCWKAPGQDSTTCPVCCPTGPSSAWICTRLGWLTGLPPCWRSFPRAPGPCGGRCKGCNRIKKHGCTAPPCTHTHTIRKNRDRPYARPLVPAGQRQVGVGSEKLP